jgi:pyruvate kinase
MKVLLDDGAVILTVTQVNDGDGTVICSVDNSGELRSRAGVNLPMAETDLPAMSEKDKTDIKYGLEIDVDYVAASFIQTADGVREIRDYMKACAKELGWEDDRPLPLIISKIESASALKHFDEILEESDGIMVARGDLGVEIPIQQVTNAQKGMVAACNAVGKPVIVATQMLESMAKNPRPTRAEVSDVTNAVYDGKFN